MPEPAGQVAGRLSVIVEASLAGFRRELKKRVEGAAKGVEAEVGVSIDGKSLRKQLQAKVDSASKGIEATIGIDVDAKTLRAKVEAAAKAASTSATVAVDADTSSVTPETVAAAEAAEKAAPTIRIPLRVRARNFVSEVLAKRAEAQAAASAGGGIKVPVSLSEKKKESGGFSLRTLLRGSVIFSLASLLAPGIGAIGQVVAGLTAMTGAAAPALGILAGIPSALAGGIQALTAGKVAAQGMGDAIKLLSQQQAALARGEKLTAADQEKLNQVLGELSPSAAKVAKEFVGLRGEWVAMRKKVQEALFSRIAGEIKPLAEKMLPTLEKGWRGAAAAMGDYIAKAAQFLESDHAQGDVGKVMANNNVVLRDFLYMVGQFGKGSLDFLVASRRFSRGAGSTMRDVGDWFSGKMERGRKSGSTVEFLDRAAKKASQLWRILTNIGGGIAGIFRAGTDSGNRLLHTFDKFTAHWHEWVDSAAGQDYLAGWFRGSEKGFKQFSKLVNDTFKGIAKWADDPNIAPMLKQIRTELGPALGDFLQSLGQDAGGGVIDFLTQLARGLNHLEPAIQTVSLLTKAITELVKALNDLADAKPGTTDVVAEVLGGLLLASSAKRLFGMGKVLAGVSKGAKGLPAAGAGAAEAATGFGRLSGALSRLGRMPLLKKAGLVGLVITAADLAKSGKAAYDAGKTQAERLVAGFRDGAGTSSARSAVSDALETLLGPNSNPFIGKQTGLTGMLGGNQDLADFAKKIGVDTDRLKDEISRLGTTGDYYKSVLKKLDSYGSLWKNPAYGLPGVDTDGEDAKSLAGKLRSVAQDAAAALKEALKHEGDKIDLGELLLGPMNLAPSDVANKTKKWADSLTAGWRKAFMHASSGRQDDVDAIAPKGPTGASAPAANPWDALYAGGKKPKKIKAPKLDMSAMDKQLAWARRRIATGLGKKIKAPKLDAKGLAGQSRSAGKSASDAMRKAMGKKIPSPKLNTTGLTKSAAAASKSVRHDFDAIPKAARQTFSATAKAASKGMQGVVTAIKSKAGPAKAGATTVANNAKQPFLRLRGPMSSAGVNAMAGFTAGIRSEGAKAVAAAASIAAQVAAATRNKLEIQSPSKVMQRLGHWVSAGFAKGIKGGLKDVQRVQDGLWSRLTGKVGRQRVAALKRQFSAEFRVLEYQAKLRGRLSDQIDRVANRVNNLKSARANMKSSLKTGAQEFGSIGSISQDNGGMGDPGFILDELKRRAKDSKKFRRSINRLRKRGLGKNAIQQIIDLGMEDGLPLAQQLLSGTPEQLKKMNRLQAIISKQAKKLGIETAKGFFDSGIKAGQGMLHALRSRQKELNKVAARMGQALVNEIRRALGLKVTKKDIKKAKGGHHAPPEHHGGVGGVGHLREAARQSHRKSSPGKRPHAGAGGLTDVSHAGAAAASMASAPLVGELTITGIKDAQTARDALDETYFMLRRIRLGGLHADRTA